MKRIFTIVVTACFVLSAMAVENFNLSFNNLKIDWGGGGGSFDATTGALKVSMWASNGWELYPMLYTSEYSGAKIEFADAVTQDNVVLVIEYATGDKQEVRTNVGESAVEATFDKEGGIASVKIQAGWSPTDAGDVNVVLKSAVIIGKTDATAPVVTSDFPLDFNKIVIGWSGGGGSYNSASQTLTIKNWAQNGWEFTTPVSTNDYRAFLVKLSEGAPKNMSVNITYDGIDGEQVVILEAGVSTITGNFEQNGLVKSLKIGYGEDGGTEVSVVLSEASLLMEAVETFILEIDANANTDNAIYDLRGQRMEHPGKGIYIKNGKKFIIK